MRNAGRQLSIAACTCQTDLTCSRALPVISCDGTKISRVEASWEPLLPPPPGMLLQTELQSINRSVSEQCRLCAPAWQAQRFAQRLRAIA